MLLIGTTASAPFNLGPLGAPGCIWQTTSANISVALPPNGVIQVTIPVGIANVDLWTQWVIFDPAANPLGVALSDARLCKIR